MGGQRSLVAPSASTPAAASALATPTWRAKRPSRLCSSAGWNAAMLASESATEPARSQRNSGGSEGAPSYEHERGPDRGERDDERQVEIAPREVREDARTRALALHDVEVEPPERECERHPEPARREDARVGIRVPRDAADGADHDLAEDDDDEEAEALREPRGGEARQALLVAQRRKRRPEVDEERDAPEDELRGGRHEHARDEEQDARAEAQREAVRHGARLRGVEPAAHPEEREERARRGVREREAVRARPQRLVREERHRAHREHLQEREHAVRDVLRVETLRVERPTDPDPPDRDERQRERAHTAPRDVLREPLGGLRHDDDEDEVVEELGPPHAPVGGVLLGEKPGTLPPDAVEHAGEAAEGLQNVGVNPGARTGPSRPFP